MMVIDSESTTKIEQNQEPKIGAAVKARLEQTEFINVIACITESKLWVAENKLKFNDCKTDMLF